MLKYRSASLVATLISAILFAPCGCSSSSGTTDASSNIPAANTAPAAALAAPAPPAGVTAIVDDYQNELNATVTANKPGVGVLSQFLKLWTPGTAWNNGTVLNSDILSKNVAYTANLTAARTPAQEVAAYMDDRRNQSYSILDGLGPLTINYLVGANYTTTIPITFDANTLATTEYDDVANGGGNAAGDVTSPGLGAVAQLVFNFRSFSTTPAKNTYQYPRPFRMSNSSVVSDLGTTTSINATNISGNTTTGITTTTGTRTWPNYGSLTIVAPSLVVVRSQNPASDGAFPSGHTNAATLAALAIGYAIPERFQEMIARASELGNNRIIAGMHDPLDVMGGRMAATSWAAAVIYNNYMVPNEVPTTTKQQAYTAAHTYLYAQTNTTANTLYSYAHQYDINTDRFADWATNKAQVTAHLTYGFPQINATNVAPIVPKGAEALLETRQPYLTADQRRWEIYTTELPSGYPLLDDPEGWGRVNLFAAADGMGALNGNVFVNMDATQATQTQNGYYAVDSWRNDISGTGELFLSGTGTLKLTGNNSFSGGVQINGGTIEADSASALGTGNVILNGGTLVCNADVPVTVVEALNLPASNTLQLDLGANNAGTLVINGAASFKGALNIVLASGFTPVTGTTYNLITTNSAYSGTFSKITVSGTSAAYTTKLTQTGLTITF